MVSALSEKRKNELDKKLGEFNSRANYSVISDIEFEIRKNFETLKERYTTNYQKLEKLRKIIKVRFF